MGTSLDLATVTQFCDEEMHCVFYFNKTVRNVLELFVLVNYFLRPSIPYTYIWYARKADVACMTDRV